MGDRPVGVLGAGYVGLTTAACLAHLGHRVVCVDNCESKVDDLCQARVPIGEPGLEPLVRAGLAAGRLRFATDLGALGTAGVVVLCLPTPMAGDGTADLDTVERAASALAGVLGDSAVLAVKSTVPVGTSERIAELIDRADVAVVSNPEFLREGHAVEDFLSPARIVIGAADPAAADRVATLYAGLSAPLVRTDPASAELGKYASNAYLAMRLSYVNSLAELCERVGADIGPVTEVMGLDDRIGPAFLAPGPGWGGSCLPKDTNALLRAAAVAGVRFDVLRATVAANAEQRDRIVAKVRTVVTGRPAGSLAGARIGVLGLTFKAGTDDLRDSPALAIVAELADSGATVVAHDPVASSPPVPRGVHVVDDPVLVAKDASAIVVLTEWPLFRTLDWAGMAELAQRRVVLDTRNLLDPDDLLAAGFTCRGLGRPVGQELFP
jgi:UDPglucose 6-dehydrogenase